MALQVSSARAFRTLIELRGLVEAVRDAPPTESEPDWLEWKSQVDLREKRWLFEIARHSLGFANRQPDAAASVADGCGYVLMGVEPGKVWGVQAVDVADIDSTVIRYVGSDGPRWTPHFVEVAGKSVLVVITEAPSWGDRPHALRRAFDKYADGDVFVRRHGKTQRANSAELRMLDDRSRRKAAQLAVEVAWPKRPEPIAPLDLSASAVDQWESEERGALLAPLDQPKGLLALDTMKSIGSIGVLPEDRTEEAYREEVETYLRAAREHLPAQVRRIAVSHLLKPLEVQLINHSDRNYEDLMVELYVSGNIHGFLEPNDVPGPELPGRPRPFGTRRHLDLGLQSGFDFPRPSYETRPPRRTYIDNEASARIRFQAGHLRPEYQVTLEQFFFTIDASHAGEELKLEWHVTARNVDGLVGGTLPLTVGADVLTPQEVLIADGDGDE
jgi:hypothetical protein